MHIQTNNHILNLEYITSEDVGRIKKELSPFGDMYLWIKVYNINEDFVFEEFTSYEITKPKIYLFENCDFFFITSENYVLSLNWNGKKNEFNSITPIIQLIHLGDLLLLINQHEIRKVTNSLETVSKRLFDETINDFKIIEKEKVEIITDSGTSVIDLLSI